MLAKILFELAVKLKEETGAHISFINLSGGIGILIVRIRSRMTLWLLVKVYARFM